MLLHNPERLRVPKLKNQAVKEKCLGQRPVVEKKKEHSKNLLEQQSCPKRVVTHGGSVWAGAPGQHHLEPPKTERQRQHTLPVSSVALALLLPLGACIWPQVSLPHTLQAHSRGSVQLLEPGRQDPSPSSNVGCAGQVEGKLFWVLTTCTAMELDAQNKEVNGALIQAR